MDQLHHPAAPENLVKTRLFCSGSSSSCGQNGPESSLPQQADAFNIVGHLGHSKNRIEHVEVHYCVYNNRNVIFCDNLLLGNVIVKFLHQQSVPGLFQMALLQ